MTPHGAHPLDVVRPSRPADLHLDGLESPRQILVRLAQKTVEGKIEIDPARIARYPRIMATKESPERYALSARLEVPQGNVHGRHGEADESTSTSVVKTPPHALPEGLDAVSLGAKHDGPEVALDQALDGPAPHADRVGITQSLGPIAVRETDGDQLEVGDGAVRAVGERGGKGNAVVSGDERVDDHRSLARVWPTPGGPFKPRAAGVFFDLSGRQPRDARGRSWWPARPCAGAPGDSSPAW